MPDKLGMRCPGRQTIRPALPRDQVDLAFEIGTPVDAWWSDGWWEGVVTGNVNFSVENLQVYIPSENLLLNTSRKNLRVSRDWMGDHWVDIEVNHDILSAISALVSSDTRVSISSSTIVKEPQSYDVPMSCHEVPTTTKLDKVEEEKLEPVVEHGDDSNHVNGSPGRNSLAYAGNDNDNVEGNNDVGSVGDDGHKLEECETDGQKCEPELLEVVA
ncbi:hypothetical protein Acr_17g0009070 [Actinidia rufa]|uniref:Agenet domain-containing protein n=1 Tax=Actinidia rufa TaxID=165716 RepID=A0A7J0G3G9_9ERIC|nr:hypothetical protein Acr_17g0009070 [Actinidia rufa]